MSLAFTCHHCFRSYQVALTLAGKRVRCKDCGTELRVPTAPAAPPPTSGRGLGAPAGPAVADLYGLDEGPASRYPKAPLPDDPPPPPRAAAPKRRRSSSGGGSGGDDEHKLLKAGLGFCFFGGFAFLLPRFGYVLSSRRGHPMDPQVQTVMGAVMALVGALLVAASFFTRGTRPARKKPRTGAEAVIRICLVVIAAVVGLVILIFTLAVALPILLNSNRPGPMPTPPASYAPPAAAPNAMPPSAGPPSFGPPTRPGDDVRVVLSNGKIMRNTLMFGAPKPGVEISVDYRLEQGRAVGAQYSLVIKSARGIGKLTTFRLQASDTIHAESLTMSLGDGPYEAYMEVQPLGNQSGRIVSNTVPLQQVEPPQAEAGPPGMPGAMPGMPGAMPGMPGIQPPGGPPPGPPGFPRPQFPRGPRFGRP